MCVSSHDYEVKGVFFGDHVDKLYATFLVIGSVFYLNSIISNRSYDNNWLIWYKMI